MNLLQIKELFAEHYENSEFNPTGNLIIGKINGYHCQLSLMVNGLRVDNVLHILVNRNLTREDMDVIKCIKFKGLYDYISVDVISIRLSELESKKEEDHIDFINKLDNLFNVFDELALKPCIKCHICGNEIDEDLKYCFRQSNVFGGVIGISHSNCLEKNINDVKNEILKNDSNTKKIPLAITLCLLFSILFNGLLFLLTYKVNVFFDFVLYALIPILSVIYLLTKAPNKKYQLYIIIGSALVGYLSYLLTNILVVGFSIVRLGLQILFLCVGSITTIKSILANTNEQKLKQFEEKKDE